MHILIVSATPFEILQLRQAWEAGEYAQALRVEYLITGVGPVPAGVAVAERLSSGLARPDLLLNLGVAGALDTSLNLGDVVQVTRDSFGDLGVEDRDGRFISVFELGLASANAPPYENGALTSVSEFTLAQQVSGVTVSTAHGHAESINAFKARSSAQVETMEGAAVAYAAFRQNVPHLQLRAISNYVEPRDRAAWQLDQALINLTAAADQLLSSLPGAVAARSAKRQLGL